MRFLLLLVIVAAQLMPRSSFAQSSSSPAGGPAAVPAKRPAWTSSRIQGSPDPPPPYRVERLFPQLSFRQPVAMGSVPGTSRLYVVELEGKIVTLEGDSGGAMQPMLLGSQDIPGLTAVYGLAFHPNFKTNRQCFLCYILAPNQPRGTRVSRFRVSEDAAPRIDPASEEVLITWRSGGHNGGCLKFGPDGYLYISTGDATAPSPPDALDTGQDLSDLESSILRIDVNRTSPDKRYATPEDNPFVNRPGARPEIWAYGLRNPWRMSFDTQGRLWVGDVGWELWEMIYCVRSGSNFGWSVMEGPQAVRPEAKRGPTAITPPVIAHPRADAASITGGCEYRGSRLPKLRGAYVYGDFVTGKLWGLRYDGEKITWHQELADTDLAIITFFEDHAGELGFLDYNKGTVHRLVPNESPPANLAFPTRLSETGLFSSVVELSPAPGVIPFSVNAPQWQDGAISEHLVAIPGPGTIVLQDPKSNAGAFPPGTVLVKTISREMRAGSPASRRRLETQLLHLRDEAERGNSSDWVAYTYVWNEEQDDALLAPAGGTSIRLPTQDEAGNPQPSSWRISGRGECYACHNPWAGYRLAFTLPQLHVGARDNLQPQSEPQPQLQRLADLGVLRVEASDPFPALVNPHDERQDLNARARSYLQVNCAHCHRFGGGGTATIDLRFDIEPSQMKCVGERPSQGTFGIHDARIVAAGDPYRSTMLYRVCKLGPGRMPHIGSQVVDLEGVQLLRRWIESLPPDGGADGATAGREKEKQLVDQLRAMGGQNESSADAVIGELLASTSGSLRLLQALEDPAFPRPSRQRVAALGVAASDMRVRDLFERFVPESQRTQRLGAVVKPEEILALEGDRERGGGIFLQSGAACKSCHKVGTQGAALGPDLSQLKPPRTRRQLLDSILDPSRTVDSQYQLFRAETVDGRVLQGILVRKDEQEIVLRTAKDELLRLLPRDVETFAPLNASLMPELSFRDLTAQQLADLLEFLYQSQQSSER